jgi:arsenate reductase
MMVDGAIRLLSLANQLAFTTRRVRLDFEEGEAGTMGYLNRMGFFDHLDPAIDVIPAMPDTNASTFNVLFLCTGNSARSIMAESILRQVGTGRFSAFSAGSHPAGRVNTFALELLECNRMPTDGLRSKNWDEFAQPDSLKLDFVFTVCDNAAGEVCPVWPGQPMTAHWGIPDPAAVERSDEDKRRAFAQASRTLLNRIRIFASLPLSKLDRLSLQRKLDELGKSPANVELP